MTSWNLDDTVREVGEALRAVTAWTRFEVDDSPPELQAVGWQATSGKGWDFQVIIWIEDGERRLDGMAIVKPLPNAPTPALHAMRLSAPELRELALEVTRGLQ